MLIALCSVKGSPGVTTLAVALAVKWPQTENTRRLVAEVDPAGGDLAMRFGLPASPGLVSLAAAARRTRDPAVVWEHTQALPSGARVLLAPPGGAHARAALSTLATAPDGPLLDVVAQEPGVVALADCGRVDPGSPAEAIARRADALVLVIGTQGDDLAHTAARLGELARWTPRPGLLLTGDGYPTADVERELGVPAIGRIPHDPAAAATLTGHRPPPARRRGNGGLAQQAAALARTLAGPAAPAASPSANAPGAVPGVPAQQVRHQRGGGVITPPGPAPHPPRLVPAPPQVSDPHRNGHQPSTAGKEPPV
ncbi:carbon monoxide dehydrogenase maturation protein [Amycolatopsis rubida]|uniref:MinD-like ATPase involved in chromosome partitioning or flagellar assembly n=1 Tax=Amycolatopsis rubida TaxID=112413 RepID=A0A1I5E284_9PSEU|nr:carbon monoxide dehydrogenase maturation protein [Amycolatopsis rubida]SFO05400.1 MinD-like ATPase involved in chromosome partitioning or flagellar assembly [Amycolatopsis rubida]